MSALFPKADVCSALARFGFGPIADMLHSELVYSHEAAHNAGGRYGLMEEL